MNGRIGTLLALAGVCLLVACGKQAEQPEDLASTETLDTLVLAVNGMTCDGCVETVTTALKKVPAARAVTVSLADANATVVIADGPGEELDALVAAVTAAGYTVGGQEPEPVDTTEVEVATEQAIGE